MRDLQSVLDYSFDNINAGYGWRNHSRLVKRDESLYMEVPINEDTFEVPTFALGVFESKDISFYANPTDVIVLELNCLGARSDYKSLDASIRDILATTFSLNHLAKITTVGDPSKTYYGTQGAIFDENYKPVMMTTWEIKRIYSEECDQSFRFRFIRPILRVSPEVVINKYNTVERYIVNKIIPTTLSLNYIQTPKMRETYNLFENTSYSTFFKAKVIIDKCPFALKEPDVPSISTTNSNLLNVALEHLDELVQ